LAAFVGFIPAGRKVYLAFAALAAATQGKHVVPLGNPRTTLPCDNIPLSAQMPVTDHDGASLPRPGLTRVPSLVCPAFLLTGLGNPTTRGHEWMELRFSFSSGIFSGKLNFSRFNLPLFLHPASFGRFLPWGFYWCYSCGLQGLFGICRVGGGNPRGTWVI